MTSSLSILSVALSNMTSPSSSSLLFLLGLPSSIDDAPFVFALLAKGSASTESSSRADRFRGGAGGGVDGRGLKGGFGNDDGNINAGASVR